MRSTLVFILASLLIFPPLGLLGAQEKPAAALARVAVLGEISEAQKKIIITRLESKLSDAYQLVTQEQYRRAEEEAFAVLDVQQCTEEECIRKIQEILQVERLFILQIIREQELTQLSLNLVRSDSKRVVEKVCEKCTIGELHEQVDVLAGQLIAEDLPTGRAVAAAPEEKGGGFVLWTGIAFAVFSTVQFADAFDKDEEAKNLAQRDPQQSSQREADRDDAADTGLAAAVISAGLLAWWIWGTDDGATARSGSWQLAPFVALPGGGAAPGLLVSRRW